MLRAASTNACSKRAFFMPERSYSVRSAFCSQSSASSSVLRSGNGFDITPDLFVVHEANAHRPDLFAAPGENAEYPPAGAVAEDKGPSLARDERIANDINVPSEQSLDLRQS